MVRRMQGLVIVAAATVLAALGLPNDFFEGCRELEPDAEHPDCVYVPREWLKSETYRSFAHVALGNYSFHSGDYYNTVLKMTRAANRRILMGIGTAVEFTTVPSSCKVTDTPVYSKELCRPTSNKVNGLCQAKFNVFPPRRLLAVSCRTLA
uniref:Putative cystatin-like 1 protein n=2 Tax=Ixodes ricinus TaxID=34613 RepID=V5HGI4_IXORI